MQVSAMLRKLEAEIGAMARLAVPVVIVQVGLMLMGVVDTVVVGHLDARALAAVAVGHLYVVAAVAFPMGVLLALDPLVAQAVGAGDHPAVTRAVQRGLVLGALLCLPSVLFLIPGELILGVLRQPSEVVPVAAGYARINAAGVLPFLAFVVLRQTLQAMERVRPVVVVIVVANLANLVLDWVLVFGVGPFPRLEALGSAWATVACRWLLALALVAVGWRELRPHMVGWSWWDLRPGAMLATLRLGAPIGAQLQLELAAFGAVALLMGAYGATEVASHQVAITLASLTFMVPLGVSAAAAVRVGNAVGAEDAPRARRAAAAALACGAGFMAVTGAVFLAAPGLLAAVFTDVAPVRALAARLIPVAGVFQVFDGLQVVAIGVLRGVGDTRTPMVVNVLGFWLLGMPAGVGLAFGLGLGPVGLWWGLVIGLGIVAALLLGRVARQLAGPVRRLSVP